MNEIEKLKQENAELKRQLKSQRLQDEFDIGTVKFTEQETHCKARFTVMIFFPAVRFANFSAVW